LPGLTDFPSDDAKTDLTRVNRQVEDLISIAPEQYLWMHKRFKTRPDKKDQSFY
jgi:KDO2-lipid IV(A) lauroyltransferase